MAKGRGREVCAARRSKQKNRRDPIIILTFILLFALIIALIAYQKKFHGSSLSTYYANLARTLQLKYSGATTTFSVEKRLPNTLRRPPPVAPEIHFEFYTTLANAKMPEPMEETVTKNLPIIKKKMPEITATNRTLLSSRAAPSAGSSVPNPLLAEKKIMSKSQIISEDALQRNIRESFLDAEKKTQLSSTFMLQFGIFHETAAADRVLSSLQKAGLNPSIVTIKQGPLPTYRIQQGPYDSFTAARIAQLQLQQRGVKTVIHAREE